MKRLKMFLITLLILTGSIASRAATEMYAVLNGSTLTFYYDGSKASRSGTKYAMNAAGYAPGWYNNKSIKTVVFDSSFKNARPTTCDNWFYGLTNLTSVTGMVNLNTSSATSMNSMFYECTSLTSLDVSNINTSKATDLGHMFYTCSALTSLDISKFTLTSSQNTKYIVAKSGLKTLTIPATANVLDQTACSNVGSASAPCSLNYPSGFTPEKMSTGSGWYMWKYGYFKDGTSPTPTTTEAYAVLSGSTLTFYYDKNKSSRSGTKYSLNTEFNDPGWNSKASTVTKVVFDGSFKSARPTSTYEWFQNMSNLTNITGIANLNTSNVMNMYSMFEGCGKLTTIDLSNFNTNNVENMGSMFMNCPSLTSLDLSKFNTAKVRLMPDMFQNCSSLKTLNLSSFNTANVVNFISMFENCSSLTSIDVGSFTTQKCEYFGSMFEGCTKLTTLNLSSFTFISGTNTYTMLNNCPALTSLTIPSTAYLLNDNACCGVGTQSKPCVLNYPSGFTPEKTSTGSGWYQWKGGYFKDSTAPATTEAYAVLSSSTLTFYYDKNKSSRSGTKYSLNTGSNAPGWSSSATSVTKVVFNSTFASASPTSCFKWFYNMSKLTTITGLNYLNTEKVTNMSYMFSGCSLLTSLDLKDFNTAKVIDMSYMFNGCSKLSDLVLYNESSTSPWAITTYYSDFVTTATTNLRNMFSGCTGLKNLELPDFVITTSKTSTDMFKGCSGLESLHIQGNWTGVNASAFSGVGTTSKPCVLEFDEATISGETSRTPTYFVWKAGYFKDYRKTYVVFMEDTGTLTFCYSRFMGSFMPEMHDYSLNEGSAQPEWVSEFASKVKKVVIDEGFKDARPTSCYQWFYNMTNLTAIEGLDNLNTEYVTNYASMFSGCKKLTSMDISKFTLTSSTNSKLMFNGCSGLKTLTVPATAGFLAADACKGVGTASAPITLNYPSSFTPQPTSTGNGYMVWKGGYFKDSTTPTPTTGEMYAVLNGSTLTFYYDYNKSSRTGTKYAMNTAGFAPNWASNTNIKTVVFDSSFKNARPTTCNYWFYKLTNLTSITGMANLNTSSTTSMNSMFYECTSLTSLNVSNINTSKATDIGHMFYTCSALTSLDISNFTLTSSQNTQYMMAKSGLKTLTIPATASVLDQTACANVGSAAAPCSLVFPSSFTPEKMATGSGWYMWKYGYFKDGKPASRLGDANADGEVNITDVVTIVDYVLDRPILKFSFTNADMNKDNQIGLVDALRIVDIILGRAYAPAKPQFSKQNVMFLSGQGSELDLHLKGTGTFRGAEMTLVLPEGCSLHEAVLNPVRSEGHELLVNDLGNGVYRLVVMGSNGKSFGNGGTALIHLSLDGNYGNGVRVSDILMTSADLETIALEGVQGIATGIDGLAIDGSASDGEWYNLQGQRVTSPHHGIYIRNGKKYTVK